MYKFYAYLSRMKYITRWNLMRCSERENIMEHSHHVAVIAHALALISNHVYGNSIDADKTAVYALFHDASEVITGDLPTPIKYINESLNVAYKDIEKNAAFKLIKTAPDFMKGEYEEILEMQDKEIKKLVEYADKISAYIKCLEELKSGNGDFRAAAENIKSKLVAYNSKEVDYFMKNMLPAYELTLDELNDDKV
jgi:5'-deoxynucleotidase